MRYIVKAYRQNKGSFKNKDGVDIHYDKIDLQCATKDQRPNAIDPVGEAWRETISINNDFSNVVVTNGLAVTSFNDLIGCEIKPFYNRWGKTETVSVVAVNAKF